MRGEGDRAKGRRHGGGGGGSRAQDKQPTSRVFEGLRSTLKNRSCDDGETPLMFAVKRGNKAIVKYLIKNHADPNKGSNSGVTPLHAAAQLGHCEIAKYLLSKGANVEAIDHNGGSPLICAAIKGHEGMVTLLLKHNADYNRLSNDKTSPLLASVHCESLECLEKLIQAGADVNGTGCWANPVMLAAVKGFKGCLECLLRNGADPNMPNLECKIPIDAAAANGHVGCVEILLRYTTPLLPRYHNKTSVQIVLEELNMRLEKSTDAIEQGDAAFGRRSYDTALASYTEAINLGHKDPDLYAKRSLCHLHLHDQDKYAEDAINYMNMVRPDLSTAPAPTEASAKRLVLEFGKTWKAPGSGSNPSAETDKASR